ncbi:hypothetical protein Pan241w_44660 [Gimesia alba]|uniref:Uncharacterized protein n=1 Tax=Gimesia alba TaxID=2527973 RepID=A0A517RKF0_9PLAN|nr:hypothetical protein [Gimesia alba]QDT44357.1 hypothetical protein Pan241w_44660 [Gimesia alba]
MKSTLATVFIVLFVACILKFDSPVSTQTQVNAQTPESAEQDPLFDAIQQFMEHRADREQHSDRREPESELLLAERPHDADHRREEERHREAMREREHQLQQHKHRIENMHVAARHLEEAGMHDMARQIHREAKEQEHHLHAQIERDRHHEHHPPAHQELHELLHQLRNEVRELKQEVRELREIVVDKHHKPEIEEEQLLR